jgi:hypothetical protein
VHAAAPERLYEPEAQGVMVATVVDGQKLPAGQTVQVLWPPAE